MPAYDKGMLPQDVQSLLVFLREELQRIEAFAHTPRSDGAWDDLRFPAQAITIGGGAPPPWNATYGGLSFAPNSDQDIAAVVQMPHSWREGTNVRPHIHWEPGTGLLGATAVVWQLCVLWRNNGETEAAKTCYTVTVTPTPSSTLALMITPFPELDATGKNISSIMDITLTRLGTAGADNFTGNAILKEFDIHYLTDSFGSDLEYVKR